MHFMGQCLQSSNEKLTRTMLPYQKKWKQKKIKRIKSTHA